ncbi:apextrin-like protein 1 [Elysia marginata]|uniref:Apextrin-like protein 1 n=1 Tax=Elysia marginata TaxID=1093978 RepID=A0AAV4FKR5_9GAST|nr:apextrin-like protein 1 [Elysia marginata]
MILHQISLLAFLLVLHRGLTLPVRDVSDPSMPLQLTVSPALVNRYTAKTMSLRCEHNPSVPSKVAEIIIMRIFKKSTSGWDLVAEQRDVVSSPTVTGNVTASANIKGDIQDAFLQVTWNTLGPDCFGVFKCNVMGFDSNDDTITERSSTLEVYEFKNFIHHLIALSVDTQRKMLEMENFTDSEITRLNDGFQVMAKSVHTNQSAFDSRLNKLENRITQQEMSMDTEISQVEKEVKDNKISLVMAHSEISEMEKEIKDNKVSLAVKGNEISQVKSDLLDTEDAIGEIRSDQNSTLDRVAKLETLLGSLIQWPAGHYALLKPKTGCPADLAFYGENRAYLKLHTESQSSRQSDDHSSAFPSDTKSTVGSNRFFTLQFCEVIRQFNTASWPNGSFCIHKLEDHSCPEGFNSGSVHFDTEDSSDKTEDNTNAAFGTYLYFCCQNSGPANTPIQLPIHSPFLLYRHGGACQAVQGMSITNEYLQINTEDDRNGDSIHDHYPDIDQYGTSVIQFNLCYYTKL